MNNANFEAIFMYVGLAFIAYGLSNSFIVFGIVFVFGSLISGIIREWDSNE